ncbi:MAG: putative hydro-lyase [bacterium]
MSNETPAQIRRRIREGGFTSPTPGLAPGYAQANLVVLPQVWAYDFLVFCQRNPKPCPVLEVTDPGNPEPKLTAPQADLRSDLPRYRLYRHGVLAEEATDIRAWWRDDLVSFLIGCSFTFETALRQAGVPVRHIEEGVNVPMYKTNIPCVPAGRFHGNMVVSMRPIPDRQIVKAVMVTSRYPSVHGAPIHIGSPDSIGIKDIGQPDFGDAVTIAKDEVPVFWACGVTPQNVAVSSRPEFMLTHAPGHMFITDIKDEDLAML